MCVISLIVGIVCDRRCGQDGYEYRHVGWATWMRSVICLGQHEGESGTNILDAAKDAALVCAFDALPLTEVT